CDTLFYTSVRARPLHSFPTRRSSDLGSFPRPSARGARLRQPRGGRRGNVAKADPPPSTRVRGRRGRDRRRSAAELGPDQARGGGDRKSTRLNSSHQIISYAVFCLKKK